MRKFYKRNIKIDVSQDEWVKIHNAIHQVLWTMYPKLYVDCFPEAQEKANNGPCVDKYWFENLVNHVDITVKKTKIVIMDPNTKKIVEISQWKKK